ncbi:MAG: phospholipid/cholesterol/gamma-HCH transport system substrate-binding protein [Pseudonocardiales bacterium]|nr:phospholipid/cholesterol/gamma-HCH transport system substrate-binding protein [Pseudonocardiales bacterium]
MTAVRRISPGPAAARERRARLVECAAGIALIAASVVAIGLVYATFRGSFGDAVHVQAGITDAGDSLEPGDAVIFRDIIVGEVRSASAADVGGARVGLDIQARYARVIPDNVLSIAVPMNLFGSTAVELVPPGRPSGRFLRAGLHISADTSPAAAGLQTALADAYTLLTAVRPADLDTALTALATALRGRGADLGRLVVKADAYLKSLAADLPAFERTISELATVTDQLAANAPDLLGSLRDMLAGARTITARQEAITRLFGIAPRAAQHASALLDAVGDHVVTIVDAQRAVLAAFADNPQALPRTLRGFRSFADAFSSTLQSGPWANVNVLATGINASGLGPLLLGQPSKVLTGITDPPLYTAAQCPRYPGLAGPTCITASTLTTGTAFGGTVSSVGTPAELSAARTLVSSIGGRPVGSVPAAVDLIVGPLLRGAATVIL